MQHGQDLFVLQSELIDKKVEVSVNNNLIAVNNAIISLREEMVALRHEVRQEISELRHEFGARLTVVEVLLRKRLEKQTEVRNRFLDVAFKACWALLFALLIAMGSFLHVSLQPFLH